MYMYYTHLIYSTCTCDIHVHVHTVGQAMDDIGNVTLRTHVHTCTCMMAWFTPAYVCIYTHTLHMIKTLAVQNSNIHVHV